VLLKQAANVWRHYPQEQRQVICYAYVCPNQRLHLPTLGRPMLKLLSAADCTPDQQIVV
jgi:hypothetical protein